jgi:hypothetical protein
VAQTEACQLAAHRGDVRGSGDGRMLTGLHGVLLGGKTEGIEAHRVTHVVASHSLVAAEHIGANKSERMPHMQARA